MRRGIAFSILVLGILFIGRAYADPLVLADGEGLKGRFEQSRHLRGFDKPIHSTGQFFLLPRSSLIWQTERPFFTRMVIDNKGISQSVEGAEVTRLDFDKFPGLQVMRSTLENSLSGNWAPLEKLTGTKLQPTGDKWTLRFTPKSSGLTLPFAYLSFEMGDYLEKVEIVKANGDKDVITFSEQKQAPVKEILEAAQKSREGRP